MNDETREKLSKMVEDGLITQDSFLSFFRKKNGSIKQLLLTQYSFTQEQLMLFKSKMFDVWKNNDSIFQNNEIVLLVQIIHSGGVATRQELIHKTKLESRKLSDAIQGLKEEDLVDDITQYHNQIVVFLNLNKFREVINK